MTDSEKTSCLNCNSELNGIYCSFCGQRHQPHKESFGELVYKFFSDFTHFDSRFFRSIIPLLFRPGTLTLQYIQGRRASQFHPIRLYLFSSFVYFLLFFGCSKTNQNIVTKNPVISKHEKDSMEKSGTYIFTPFSMEERKKNNVTIATSSDSTTKLTLSGISGVESLIEKGVTPEEYVRMQDSLPVWQRDNFIRRYTIKQSLKLYHEGLKDGEGLLEKIGSSVMHNIPKMLFILLPLFAMLLKIVYFRGKQFYYVDHAIFSLHYFSFVFILLILSQFIFDNIFQTYWFRFFAFIWIALYLFVAMKRIYNQGFFKTFLKYFFLSFSFAILLLSAFIINLLLSAAMA